MNCGQPSSEPLCLRCSASVPPAPESVPPDASVLGPPPGDGARSGIGSGTLVASSADIALGARIGRRYEIVRLLGRGGMGAVYLARDHALGRDVALKVVAAHLADDEGVALRFKREIQLSSLVTHPNVLRVYDLGEADGLRFLTMHFIDGETLADVMRREERIPVDRCVALFRQICEGLAAAHAQKVLHRDLKPQNVLVDREGRVYLTDFGLARSAALSTMTRAGALMGTPQYMSPEQVKGDPADERSDIFSLGVMLHELLTGKAPFSGDTLFELMMSRTRGPPRPAREANPDVPAYLQRILDRCLAVDPALRHPSVTELLRDLDARKARGPGVGRSARALAGRARRSAAVALLAVAVLAAGGLAAWRLWPRPQGPPQIRTLLVADVENRTGDQIFTGTLEPALGIALEGASFLAPLPRASAQNAADRMQLAGTGLPEQRARLVAQREGAAVVVSGFVENERPGFRVGLRAVDAFTGERIFEESTSVRDREGVLTEVARLAARLRTRLGDTTPEGVQLKEADTFSATSLEAAHEYAIGNDLAFRAGKFDEARARFREAIRLDPRFARAYTNLAAIEANLNRHAEAEKWFKLAMANSDRLTDREKYRSRGVYYIFSHDGERAIEAYSALVKQYPADNTGLAQLALAYSMVGEFGKALEYGRRALDIYPRKVASRSNVGYFAMYAGDLELAITEQQRAIEDSPTFAAAYVGLALAQLASGRADEARGTWERLRAGAGGTSAAAEGLADLALAEGRLAGARGILVKGVAEDLAAKDPDAAGRKLAMLASIELERGDPAGAASTAERALKLSSSEPVLLLAGSVLGQAGRAARATAVAAALEQRLGAAPQVYAVLVRASAAGTQRKALLETIEQLQGALKRLDHWLLRYALGRAYLDAGSFPAALDELEKCDRRRGEVTDVLVDSIPTYRLYPPVKYWLARAQEGVGSAAAAESYQAFLAMRKTEEDPLALDARRRLAAARSR